MTAECLLQKQHIEDIQKTKTKTKKYDKHKQKNNKQKHNKQKTQNINII